MTIGLNCTFGNCSWTDGTPFDYNDFTFPSNQTGCGTMSLATGYWNVENCFYKRFYVCQIPETFVVSTPPPTTTTSKATASQATPTPSISTSPCSSDDWVYFNETNSCYYWTSAFDWASAEAFCVGENAHLASVHSSTELNFLKFIYNGEVWIGLHADKGLIEFNSKWQWTDGSYLDYLPWYGTYGPTLAQ
uniref:C-type lectin domain-containing protein n=1 Tax=Panagrolaimus davidi TaxID=227884 RepID=A0A914PE89_9BILA